MITALVFALQVATPATPQDANEAAGAMRPAVSQSISAITNDGDVLSAYLDVARVRANLGDVEINEAMFVDQSFANIAAIAGRDQDARDAFDYMFERLDRSTVPEAFDFTRSVEAMSVVIDRAAEKRVVMINEAHHLSLHRRFAEELARRLFESGYTALSLEALRSDFDGPITRPLRHSDGFYTNDPAMANIVRFYLDNGGIVLGHEASAQARQAGGGRSNLQAQAIEAHLEAYPDRKLLVLSGWGHVSEGGSQTAAQLREITGLDPLTIDQTAPPPRGQSCGSQPMIYYDLHAEMVRVGASAQADLVIRHGPPCLEGGSGRAWMSEYRRVDLEAPVSPPLLVQAHSPSDSAGAVAVDQRVILQGEPVELSLRPGVYDVTYRSAGGRTHRERIEIAADR